MNTYFAEIVSGVNYFVISYCYGLFIEQQFIRSKGHCIMVLHFI